MQMIIANRLVDGRTVFLARDSEWVRSIEDGLLLSEGSAPAHYARAKEHEAECLIVDPNLIEVAITDGRRRPTAIREAIRAFGPTSDPDRG
jgi:Protein of unknown function (DUF2849)